jgi:hypothetical protein
LIFFCCHRTKRDKINQKTITTFMKNNQKIREK